MMATEPAGRPGTERELFAMTLGFGSWNAFGILAAVAIATGSILLVSYALRRGLVHRDLDGTIAEEGSEGTMPAAVAGAPAPSRTLGLAGVTLLVAGIALALIGAATTSSGSTSSGPGKAPTDCAQAWGGCPQATANP